MLAEIKNELSGLDTMAVIETDYRVKGYHLDVEVGPGHCSDDTEMVGHGLRQLHQEALTLSVLSRPDSQAGRLLAAISNRRMVSGSPAAASHSSRNVDW